MAQTNQHKGLCATCRNEPTCTFPRSPSAPVTQCEEFADDAPRAARAADGSISARAHEPGPGAAQAREMGLCSNCANLATCTFPLAARGVLYCEEHDEGSARSSLLGLAEPQSPSARTLEAGLRPEVFVPAK